LLLLSQKLTLNSGKSLERTKKRLFWGITHWKKTSERLSSAQMDNGVVMALGIRAEGEFSGEHSAS